jgi:hypothetical protein
LPPHVYDALRHFSYVRNRIVHGESGQATRDEIIRAIDSGLTILRALDAVPRQKNIVHHPGVSVYSDEDCTHVREGVRGLILESTSPGGAIKTINVYPTTRGGYQKGRQVTWEWNPDPNVYWGLSWYRDPTTDDIKAAWGESK